MRFPTMQERFDYLKLDGQLGIPTFGWDRYLNQAFYRSEEWRRVRREILLRDEGDLGFKDVPCFRRAIIHHINPITEENLIRGDDVVFDPDNLILCSLSTHNAIHFGSKDNVQFGEIVERRPYDTVPWKSFKMEGVR